MPPLDLFTVRVMTIITVLISSMATLLAWRTNRSVAGMRWFALGLTSLSIGSCIGIVASVVDGYWLMLASTTFRFGGILMVARSVRMFRDLPVWPGAATATLAAVVGISFFYWVFISDDVAMRTGILSLGIAILAGDASISMCRDVAPRDRITHWATGLVLGFVAVYMVLRGTANITGTLHGGPVSYSTSEIFGTICANVAFVGTAFGMLLASNTRLRHAAEKSALFDPLTNLPNRRFFEDRLLQAEWRARETGGRLGVIYVDLDEFKQVNDTRGHQAGDELLRKVSAAMASTLRPEDCLARVGGDEFVVLVEDVDHRSQLEMLASRLSDSISNGPSTHASYGVAIFPEDGTSAQDVMREADSAMYHAKREHRRTASRG